ncbi:hypothetical protein [Streptomyces sp. NPDC052015]|uniref:hypothetical protein n=1 Tax=Streptomyces sp. NPDC052015 TaxID=3154755 RepID=UPI003429EE2E
MSSTRTLPLGHIWLRAVVLLLAVLLPGRPAEAASTLPVAAAEIVEYDSLDTALRPTGSGSHRTLAPPPRPAPGRPPAPAVPPGRPLPVPHASPYRPDALRCVVLRC